LVIFFFFFQAEDGIRDRNVTGVQTCALPILSRLSRPAGLRHRPLAEPDVNLSAHPAPIKQTRQSKGVSVARIEVLLFPVASVMRPLDRPPPSSPIPSPPRSYASVRPSAPPRSARPAVFAAWA